jgi:hypothetical protein
MRSNKCNFHSPDHQMKNNRCTAKGGYREVKLGTACKCMKDEDGENYGRNYGDNG